MLGNIGDFKVSRTYPGNGQTGINLRDSIINITFNLDVDSKTLADGIIVTDPKNAVPVLGSISYDRNTRTASFTAAVKFKPETLYNVVVRDTVLSILGNPCKMYNFSFKTAVQTDDVIAPMLVSPANLSIVRRSPELFWKSSDRAIGYEVHLSTSDTFNVILWGTIINCPKETTSDRPVSVIPSEELKENIIYYWRVRSFKKDIDPLGDPLVYLDMYSGWSDTYRFSIEAEQDPVITPEDLTDIIPLPVEYKLLEVFPEYEFSNVGVNIKAIYAVFEGILDPAQLNPRHWLINGTHISENSGYPEYDESNPKTKILTNVHHGIVNGSWSIVTDDIRNRTTIVFQPKAL